MSLLMQQQQQRWAAASSGSARQQPHMPLTTRATPRPRSSAPVAAAAAAVASSAAAPSPRCRRCRATPCGRRILRSRHVPAAAAAATNSAAAADDDLPSEVDVVIVGAGLAGLAAARALLSAKPSAGGAPAPPPLSVLVLEASDGVGGRARTDAHPDGFLLDRGFQIFLTGYPECRQVLDYGALDLRPFYAGALVRFAGAWHRVADPLRHPIDGLLSLLPSNAVGSPLDKVNVGIFRLKCVLGGSLEALLAAEPEMATRDRLRREGFSDAIVGRFFRPFLGGIFFDRSLGVSDRLFAFVMRMLATGSNCLPARGIGAMGEQLAAALPGGTVRLGARVEAVERGVFGAAAGGGGGGGGGGQAGGGAGPVARVRVSRRDGASVAVVTARKAVVVASEGPEARRLIAGWLAPPPSGGGQAAGAAAAAAASAPLPSSLPPSLSPPPAGAPAVGTACLYFDAPPDGIPSGEAILYLNGGLAGADDAALVNNCCFPSTVAPSYAPPGRHLVSVSTIGTRPELDDAALEAGVRAELEEWFGGEKVARWRHLRTYRVPYAQPPQAPPTDLRRPVAVEGARGLFVCGDHRDTATFDGALLSGRRAAEAVMMMTM